MVRKLVTDPREFFTERSQSRRITLEIAIVLAVGIVGVAGSYYFANRVLTLGSGGGYSSFRAAGLVLGPLMGILLYWAGGSIAIHFVSSLYNGRGPMRRLLKLTAWATIPIAIGNAVRSAALFLVYRNVTSAHPYFEEVNFRFAGGFAEQAAIVRSAEGDHPAMLASYVVIILCVVASWWILSYAVAVAKKLDLEDARKVAAVPAGLFALYMLRVLLSAAGVL